MRFLLVLFVSLFSSLPSSRAPLQGNGPRAQRRSLRIGVEDVELVVLEQAEMTNITTLIRFRGGRIAEADGARGISTLLAATLSESMPGLTGLPGPVVEAREDEIRFHLTSSPDAYAEQATRLLKLLVEAPAAEDDAAAPDAAGPIARARSALSSAAAARLEDLASPVRRADEALLALAYGERRKSWSEPDPGELDALGASELAAAQRAQLAVDRVAVGVAGAVGVDDMVELWTELLDQLPLSESPAEATTPSFVQPPNRRIRLIDVPGAAQTELRIAGPGTRFGDPDFPALDLWSAAFGAGGTGLLAGALSEQAGRIERADAGFNSHWNRKGLFRVTLAAESAVAVDALEQILLALEKARDGLTPEAVDRARGLVEARYAARTATPEGALELATDLALFDFPEDFVEQHLARIQRLSTGEVQEALARHLEPERLLIVVLGPAKELAPRLEPLGQLLYETSLVDDMLAAVGGRERWARMTALETEITIHFTPELSVATHQWHDLAGPRFRVDTPVPGGTLTSVLDGKQAWQKREGIVEENTPEQLARILLNKRRRLWDLLHVIAAGKGPELREESEGRLAVLRAGVVDMTVELDARWLPVRVTYEEEGAPRTFEYSEWRETDGYRWASQVFESPANRRWEVTRFLPLEAFDESLIAR
jgi:zinc protease